MLNIPTKNYNEKMKGNKTPKNTSENIVFDNKIININYDVLHRIRQNTVDKTDSFLKIKIISYDNENEIDPLNTFWGENHNTYDSCSKDTLGIITKNIDENKIVSLDNIDDVEKNIYTSYPIFKHEERSNKNTLLSSDRLGSKKIKINDKEYISIQLFGDNTTYFYRNLPSNYSYSDIRLELDIPEYNIIKGLEKNYNNTEMFTKIKPVGNMK